MGHYLSNGTMGDMWLYRWCQRCDNDHPASHVGENEADYDNGCPILARLYLNEYPIPELIEHDYDYSAGWSPDYLECRMFSPCQRCNGGGEDDPPPYDPGPDHGVLFEVVDATEATPMLIIPNDELSRVDV